MRRRVAEYRFVVFGEPRGPWRREREQARRDAVEQKLGSYDVWGQFYATVPGDIQWREVWTDVEYAQLGPAAA